MVVPQIVPWSRDGAARVILVSAVIFLMSNFLIFLLVLSQCGDGVISEYEDCDD